MLTFALDWSSPRRSLQTDPARPLTVGPLIMAMNLIRGERVRRSAEPLFSRSKAPPVRPTPRWSGTIPSIPSQVASTSQRAS